MNKITIGFVAILSLIIGILAFLYFGLFFLDSITPLEFYNLKIQETDNNVFLLGSSHVGRLNTTNINSLLKNQNSDITVFNLASAGEKPSRTMSKIDDILFHNPKLVVYGVDYREFEISDSGDSLRTKKIPEKILLDPKQFLDEKLMFLITPYSFLFPDNPKLLSLKILKSFIGNVAEDDLLISDPYMPLIKIHPREYDVTPTDEITKLAGKQYSKHPEYFYQIDSSEIDIFNRILKKLTDANIDVLIVINPVHKSYYDKFDEDDQKLFSTLMDESTSKYDLEILSLQNTFWGLDIWFGNTHISRSTSSVYDESYVNLILERMS